jgi:hypothetical protein
MPGAAFVSSGKSMRTSSVVERSLADIALREQLLLLRQLARGDIHRRLGGARLRRAGHRSLVCSARVDAQQDLAGVHPVAGANVKRDHCAGHLCGDDGLTHRLDRAFISRPA